MSKGKRLQFGNGNCVAYLSVCPYQGRGGFSTIRVAIIEGDICDGSTLILAEDLMAARIVGDLTESQLEKIAQYSE